MRTPGDDQFRRRLQRWTSRRCAPHPWRLPLTLGMKATCTGTCVLQESGERTPRRRSDRTWNVAETGCCRRKPSRSRQFDMVQLGLESCQLLHRERRATGRLSRADGEPQRCVVEQLTACYGQGGIEQRLWARDEGAGLLAVEDVVEL